MTARRVREVGSLIDHVVVRYADGASCSCGERSPDGSDGADVIAWVNAHIALMYVSWWARHPELHPRGCRCLAHLGAPA